MELYDLGYSSSNSLGAFGGILGLALTVWMIVCMWKVFKKAGRKGRESLIPIRNVWVLFKIAGYKKWFRYILLLPLIWILVSIIFRLIGNIGAGGQSLMTIESAINWLLGICATILPLVAAILVSLGLAKKFGKHWAFGIGLLLLSVIFYGILAFDDSKYSA